MNRVTLVASIVLAQLCATAALAQAPANAEIDGPNYKPPVQHRATAEEKAEGRQSRKEAGRVAAQDGTPAEGNPIPAAARKVPRAERQQARAERKAETRRENQAGEITSKGETGYLR